MWIFMSGLDARPAVISLLPPSFVRCSCLVLYDCSDSSEIGSCVPVFESCMNRIAISANLRSWAKSFPAAEKVILARFSVHVSDLSTCCLELIRAMLVRALFSFPSFFSPSRSVSDRLFYGEMSFMRHAVALSWYIHCSCVAPCLYQIYCSCERCHSCNYPAAIFWYNSSSCATLHVAPTHHSCITFVHPLHFTPIHHSCVAPIPCSVLPHSASVYVSTMRLRVYLIFPTPWYVSSPRPLSQNNPPRPGWVREEMPIADPHSRSMV